MISMDLTHYHDLLILHAGCTLFMVGLIWIIQVVHYPLFAHVGLSEYQRYQNLHMQRITWIVTPVMMIELLCASILMITSDTTSSSLITVGFILLILIWLSTLFLQVPAHAKLTKAWNETAHTRLVWSNWIRTIAWSIRGFLALWLLR